MRKPAKNSSLTIYSLSGSVWYREDKPGPDYANIPVGQFRDVDQADGKKWQIKLAGSSVCELHRRVVDAVSPKERDKETLCLRIESDGTKFRKVIVMSRPRLRKKGLETDPKIHGKKGVRRKVHFKDNQKSAIYYDVDKFRVTIVKVAS